MRAFALVHVGPRGFSFLHFCLGAKRMDSRNGMVASTYMIKMKFVDEFMRWFGAWVAMME